MPGLTFYPPTLSSLPSPQGQGRITQPGTMGRKKIQISRILDQRNRQVSSLGGRAAGGKAFLAADPAWAKACLSGETARERGALMRCPEFEM